MATTGSVGILTYTTLIICSLYLFIKVVALQPKTQKSKGGGDNIDNGDLFENSDLGFRILNIGLLSGYVSILITNFFGFSVVPVNLLFYLFPAMAITTVSSIPTPLKFRGASMYQVSSEKYKTSDLSTVQKSAILVSCLFTLLLFYSVSRYWYSDVLYNRAEGLSESGDLINAVKTIDSAIKLTPKEAVYHDELASSLSDIALVYQSQNNADAAKRFSANSMAVISQAESYSPNNLNITRNKARIAIRLSEINPAYILDAKKALQKAVEMAPTEAKLFYNLSMVYYRIGDLEKTLEILKKTIEMKENYKDARYAYAIILSEKGEVDEAKKQLEYILEKIDPKYEIAKKALEELNTNAK